MRLVGRLVRALVALAVLVVVVAGVPALLATVGWPLPDHVPTLEELQRGLGPGALSTDVVLKGLVVMGWMLWALVMLGALVEAVAVLRHRQAPSLPGVAPFQGFARWLVSSLSLSLGGLNVAGPVLASPMAPPPAAVVLSVASGTAPFAEMAPPERAQSAAVAAPTYVVQRNDSLVGIAQAVLGDADRWQEIFDLNHEVPQAGGGALRSAGVIRTGWVLQLPADARVVTAAEAPAVALAEEDHEVHAGESMWSIAEERLATAAGAPGADVSDEEVGPYWAEVVATNAPVVRSGDPSLIYPGERLRLPGVASNGSSSNASSSASVLSPSAPSPPGALPEARTASSVAPPTSVVTPPAAAPDTAVSPPTTTAVTAPSAPEATSPPSTPPAPVVRPGVVAAPPTTTNGTMPSPPATAGGAVLRPNVVPPPSAVVDDAEETPSTTAAPARPATNSGWDLPHVTLRGPGLIGAGLLAAGVVGALDRLIRARSRRGRSRAFDPALAGNELALRVGADPEGAAFVDLGLRAMAGSLRAAECEVPDVLGVELGSRQLEVILAEASTPAPRPFSTKDRGRRWVLARRADRAELEELAEDMPAPCPTLVTVGTTGDGTRLLVDLEQAGASALVGPRAMTRQVLAAATTELATSGWADFVRLVLVGFGMAGQERVQVVGSVAEVIEDLEREAAELGTLLTEAGCSSTLEARVRGEAADAWIPTVVVCAKPPPARQARRLAAVATTAGNAGVAVVVAGELEGAWRLELAEDAQLSVEVLGGTMVSAQRLSSEEAGALHALFQQFQVPADDDGDPEGEWAGAEGEGDDQGFGAAGAEEDETPFFPDYLSGGADADSTWALEPTPAVAGSPRANGHGKLTDDDAEDDEGPSGVVEHQPRVIVSPAAPVGPPPGLPPELSRLRLLAGHDLLVGVMGPIEVWGAKPFTRAKALELVVYLTLHPGAAIDAERLMDALWPEWQLKERSGAGGRDRAGAQTASRQPTHRTLHTTTSVARDCLGTSPAGQRRLPHLHGKGTRDFYGLLDVALDFQLFRDAQARARAVLDDDRREAKRELTEALSLVRGVPFQDVRDEPRNYKWAHVSGAIDLIERHVREAALLLAELCLGDDDPDGARWAARQGLLANPGHRLLKCAELKAEGLARNPAGVEDAMRELGDVIEADDPVDSLDAHTVAVYKEQLAIALGR